MITVKLIGGAKKSFLTEKLDLDTSDISIQELTDLLLELQPSDSPKLDVNNILIAINGVDSSAMDKETAVIKNNDLVSIIPVIHGGAPKKLICEIAKKQIQIMEIKGKGTFDVKFIDELRKKYPKLKLQTVSSDFVASYSHLKKIITLSLESEKNNLLLSNKLEIDILMRFALTKQISSAIDIVGIKPKKNFILIAMGNKKTLNQLYSELNPISVNLFLKNHDSFLKKYFKITKKHLDSTYSKSPLEDILVEKAAILL
jgi:tRNA threonylcarbamoyladenosine modification (KEOPS) complex Cgi121 subunit/molybdopterin converting factor small subunit